MAELLQIAISQNIEPKYAKKLLAAFPENIQGTVDIHMVKAISPTFIEPLSERELEVLQLMIDGYRYKEVAEQLVISVNTVRHHTRNIYRKLNVNTRTQAIVKAKEMNFL